MLTQDYVRAVFRYDTGNLYWLGKRRGAPKNKPVGSLDGAGYLTCMLDGKHQLVHRMIYLHVCGYLPKVIDHINGDRCDNRIENLRATTNAGNQQNMRVASASSKSGLLGAFYNASKNQWFSRICVNGQRIWLGNFDTAEQAHIAYVNAKRKLHFTCTI